MHLVGAILVGVSILVLALTVLDRTLKTPKPRLPRRYRRPKADA
jgi:hypothetical protein